MNLNVQFKQAIIDNQYYYSAFDGKLHDINDLQVCHILSQSKRTLRSIKKAYNCDTKTAGALMNMPLLNTVIGTRQDNAEYKKTDDIVFIDYRIFKIVYSIINETVEKNFELKQISVIMRLLSELNNFVLFNEKPIIGLLTDIIKDIQYQFHKEIDLHI